MTTDPNCVFCRIVDGRLPAKTVLAAEHALALLDVGPLADGHLLVIPRKHYPTLLDAPPELCGQIAALLPRLCGALCRVTGASGFNLLVNNGAVAGQEVGHLHWHLIPRTEGDGLGYRWKPKSYPQGRIEELAEQFGRVLET